MANGETGSPMTLDLLYGYDEIGMCMSLSTRQVKHLAEKEDSTFPVFKIGRRVAAKRSSIVRWLDAKEAGNGERC